MRPDIRSLTTVEASTGRSGGKSILLHVVVQPACIPSRRSPAASVLYVFVFHFVIFHLRWVQKPYSKVRANIQKGLVFGIILKTAVGLPSGTTKNAKIRGDRVKHEDLPSNFRDDFSPIW